MLEIFGLKENEQLANLEIYILCMVINLIAELDNVISVLNIIMENSLVRVWCIY